MYAASVAARSGEVTTKLQERHNQMEDLSRVRGLLMKLQVVFQLPKQLRAAIEQGAIEIAVHKYADVASLLKAYGHKVCAPPVIKHTLLREFCFLYGFSIGRRDLRVETVLGLYLELSLSPLSPAFRALQARPSCEEEQARPYSQCLFM